MMQEASSGNERVLYAELAPQEFRARLASAPIAYLPLGTLEWHGEHLPLGSDGLQSQGFFVHLARRAGGIVLPMLFVGPDIRQMVDGRDYYGMDIVGFAKGAPQRLDGSAYWIDEAQFKALIETILGQLQRVGFKIVVAHGHGPSTNLFNKHLQPWSAQFGMQLFTCWNPADPDRSTGVQTDHAAANETSLMQALHPDLVHLDRLPADPAVWPTAVAGDDPRTHASPALGREIIRKNLEWMAQVLHEALHPEHASIRYATIADSAALADIQVMSYRTAYAGIMPASYLAQFSHEEQTSDWHELLVQSLNGDILYVAELDGRVVGYALGRPGAIAGTIYDSELVAIHVLPTYQRRGVGRRLFAAIAQDMRARGAHSLMLWTLAANPIRRWYEQLGGAYIAGQPFDIDGVEVSEIGYGWPDIDRLCARLAE